MVKSYPELVLWKGYFCCSFLIYMTKTTDRLNLRKMLTIKSK